VSLLVELLVAAGGIVVGRWLAHRLRPSVQGDRTDAEPKPVPCGLEAFSCRLGDVVVRRAERDEAWLAGALVFEEEGPVAALFIAPEAGRDRALFVHRAEEGLLWLSPLRPAPLLPRDPPLTIEHGGVRFERRRRLPVRVRTLGTHVPTVGGNAVVAEYRGPGADRMVALAAEQQTWVWVGIALRNGDYDLLPAVRDDAAAARR
jgi:hypothetical protein